MLITRMDDAVEVEIDSNVQGEPCGRRLRLDAAIYGHLNDDEIAAVVRDSGRNGWGVPEGADIVQVGYEVA